MQPMPVRIDRDEVSFTFHLSPFISDWEGAKQTFVSCITRDFGDILRRALPRDFNTSLSSEPGEARCTYRMYGGSSTMTLRPDSLQFIFPNLLDTDYPVVNEIVRRGTAVLLTKLDGYERHEYSLTTNRHLVPLAGIAEAYLAQFSSDEMANAATAEPGMRYRPSASFTLVGSTDEYRVLRRSVEQSEVLANGLFVTTHIFVSASGLSSFEDELQWINWVCRIADQAVGITYQAETEEIDYGSDP